MECHALLTGPTGGTAVRGAMRISKAIYSSAKTFDLGHTRHLAGIVFREPDWVSFLPSQWAREPALSFEDVKKLKQALAF